MLKDTLLVPSLVDNLISISKLDKEGHEIIKDGELRVWKDGEVKAEGVLKKGLYVLTTLRSTDGVVKEKAVRVETLAKWHQVLGHLHHSAVLKTEKMVDGMVVKGKKKDKKSGRARCEDGVECELGFDRPDRGRPGLSDACPKLTVASAPSGACTTPDATPTLCEPCVLGKMHALPFPRRTSPPSTAPLQLVHTDLCGPFRVATPAGHRYFITFIDDYSKYTVVRLLRRKSHASQAVKDFHEEYTKALGLPLKVMRSDNGGEYVNDDLQNWLKDRGVAVQLTTPHTPEQNGTAERTNRTLVEMFRTMMIDAGASMGYWGECALYTAWIRNRVFGSSCPEGKTPFEGFFDKRPSLEQAHPWGCLAFAHVPDATRHKLQPKAIRCIFIGVSDTSKAWRLYDRTKRRVVIARSVVFDDNVFPMRATTTSAARPADLDLLYRDDEIFHFERSVLNTPFEPHVRDNPLSEMHDAPIDLTLAVPDDWDEHDDDMGVGESLQSIAEGDEEQVEPAVRRSSRVQQPSRELLERVANALQVQDMVAHGHGGVEPKTYRAAMRSPDADKWEAAIHAELLSHESNMTFEYVSEEDAKRIKRLVTSKLVFKIKRNSDGTIERYKARLVARGFTQRFGVDYRETFAPVARMASIRTLLAVACQDDMNLTQLDVETAFLNGPLDEVIYMRLPEGVGSDTGRVVRLRKGLYGLKQASRQWYKALDAVLLAMGFTKSRGDPCIYVLERDGKRIFMAVYVDDFVMADNDATLRAEVVRDMGKHFKLKDLGELKWCLGVRVERDRSTRSLTLDQENYVDEILSEFSMTDCAPCATPEAVNQHLPKHERDNPENNDTHPYREAVGKLMYLMVCTRPDIASAVRAVSKHACSHGDVHWQAVKRIMRYLKGTRSMRLRIGGARAPEQLIGYADADWANDRDDRRSVTGYVFSFAGGPVSWSSRGQRTVALSSTEAEYMALSEACREVTWLRLLLGELKHAQYGGTEIYEDNQGAIVLARNPEHHARNKHIDMRHHYCRDKVESGEVVVTYIPTRFMIADALTKALSAAVFEELTAKIMNVA